MQDIQSILAASGALVTAVVIVVNALKAMGLPGRVMPFASIILGIGGAWLTISHDPAIFVIVGILVTGTENGIFVLNQRYFQKKFEEGEAPAQETSDPVVPSPTPPAQPVEPSESASDILAKRDVDTTLGYDPEEEK